MDAGHTLLLGRGGPRHGTRAYRAPPRGGGLRAHDQPVLPGTTEIPDIEIHHLESVPQGPIDFRGVGESGAIGAPAALTNAIEDALAPFGVRITEKYLPPHRLVALIAGAS